MSDADEWAFPETLQPSAHEVRFDLDQALDAVIALRAEVPEDAFTAPILGTERAGNGVVIRSDGLVLTIGYLITEAESVWLTTNRGQLVQAYPLAYFLPFVVLGAVLAPTGAIRRYLWGTIAATTLVTPAAINPSVQGGVRP